MTSADVAAEIATVEGLSKYQSSWASSDIDGPNVEGCNEEELNEWVIDIPGVAQNAEDRRRIVQHLMYMKSI